MLSECIYTSEGGGNKIETGTVTLAVGSQTFSWQTLTQKPTKFIMYKLSSPVANNMIHIIDDSVAASAQWYAYFSGSAGFGADSYPTTTNDLIQDLTSSGFSTKTSGSAWIGDYVYVAIVE